MSVFKESAENSATNVASKKLQPFEFFEKLGSPKLVVAPMVDHSELSYRMLTRAYGADLVFTQMFNSNCWCEAKDYRELNFTTCPEDRPLIVQFCGDDPDRLLEAAKLVQDQCDAIDINLGCPQGIAKRGHYGAFLMEELELLARIVKKLSEGLKIPVTCKTRIYKGDFDRSVKLCETLVQAGASMLTIHGRTREEKGNMVAAADWEMIAKLKEHFAGRVPIIANGGIECLDDVSRCLEETKADGVMSSEGILENPALFTARLDSQGRKRTQLDLAEEYMDYSKRYAGASIKCVRSHLMKFLYRYFVVHTDLRNRLAESNTREAYAEVIAELRERVVDDSEYDQNSWYHRHRNPSHVHAGRVDQRTVVNWQQLIMDKARDSVWNEMDEESGSGGGGGGGGLFQGLGLFDEEDDEVDEEEEDNDNYGDGDCGCGAPGRKPVEGEEE